MQSFTQDKQEKKLFLGRQQYIKLIEKQLKDKKHTIITAPKGYGKRTLLRKVLAKKDYHHINLKTASISPELLSLDILSSVLNTRPQIHELIKIPMNDACRAKIDIIDNELQKISPNQRLLLKTAIEFIDTYQEYSKKKYIVVWEHLEEFLLLKNYSQTKDIRQYFSSLLKIQRLYSYSLLKQMCKLKVLNL